MSNDTVTRKNCHSLGISTRLFNFLLPDLVGRNSGTESDIEANRSSVESRFLRHQRNFLSVGLNVELGNVLPINRHGSTERVTVNNKGSSVYAKSESMRQENLLETSGKLGDASVL